MKKKIRAEKPLPKNRTSKRVGTGDLVLPLRWVEHHVKGNGFHGHTATDRHVCYVYNRIKRGPMRWALHSYFGAEERPIRDAKGNSNKFRSAKLAKAAAQRWWAREVRALLWHASGEPRGE